MNSRITKYCADRMLSPTSIEEQPKHLLGTVAELARMRLWITIEQYNMIIRRANGPKAC